MSPDRHMLLLRAMSLVEQDEEQVAEMLVGATAEEIAYDFMGMYAVSKALVEVMCEAAQIPVTELLTRTRTRLLRSMPPIPEEK